MRGLSIVLMAAALGAAGCKPNPYCLNCGNSNQGGTGDGGQRRDGGDGGQRSDGGDAMIPRDMTGIGGDGGCVVSNGGVEVCDGLDNDCNGKIDDVAQDRLVGDPNNCGACGVVCDFTAKHQFGACAGGFDGGVPACAPAACVPGFADANHDPADGCEYACTPTTPPTEVCDGRDNDCNGLIDDGFTATWDASGKPRYDSDAANCGSCAFNCQLPGAVNKCVAAGAGLGGVCQVDHCINDPGVDTFKHDPASPFDINVVGCEYHCPVASSTAGDCSGGGACTFPAEVCDGVDNDCNFQIDDSPTDPELGLPCGTNCPGGMAVNCVGQCQAGMTICKNGVKLCNGSTGPTPEVCDGVDNDCNGLADDPFTAAAPGGYDQTKVNPGAFPLYNLFKNHCGSCAGACSLPHAVNGCHSLSANAVGSCFVVGCTSGFNYAASFDTVANSGACNGSAGAKNDTTPGVINTGAGCNYSCPVPPGGGPVPPPSPEVCDGYDNDCDGCADKVAAVAIPPPATYFCSKKGVCPNSNTLPIVCRGASGWKCDYSGVTGINLDGSGNLALTESLCDGNDNNCNGFCDENFLHVLVSATAPNGRACGNPHPAQTCTVGLGVCQNSANFQCKSDHSAEECPVVAKPLATAELCDGKDNDCDGRVDEAFDAADPTGINGWHDPAIAVTVAGRTVFVAEYEASRVNALAASAGSGQGRACANSGRLPWSNVTAGQATAACAAVLDSTGAPGRLCTAQEWQVACEGPIPPVAPTQSWSMSLAPTAYVPGVCNDQNSPTGKAWPTGTVGRPQPSPACFTNWNTVPQPSPIYDLSGNVMEWTSTPVYTFTLEGAQASIASMGTAGRMRISGLAALVATDNVDLIQINGSATHDGLYTILAHTATTADVAFAGFPANGGTDGNNGAIGWGAVVPKIALAGSTASVGSMGTLGRMRISGLAGLLPALDNVDQITLSGSTAHNGTYTILAHTDSTADVTFAAFPVSGGGDNSNGNISWTTNVRKTYYKLRGGSFSSPLGGTACEFDFDIALSTFANIDVGFRCCFDHRP